MNPLRAAPMGPAAAAAWAHSGFWAVHLAVDLAVLVFEPAVVLNELVVSDLAVASESCVLSLCVPTVVVLKEHAVHFGVVSNDVNLSEDLQQFGTASTMYAFSLPDHHGWTALLSCLL